jgi:hypothetical protein
VSGDRGNELADIRRKLVEGTEVLRTGGGATLKPLASATRFCPGWTHWKPNVTTTRTLRADAQK